MVNLFQSKFDTGCAKKPYNDKWEYLSDLFKIIDLKVLYIMIKAQTEPQDDKLAKFKGLVISKNEIAKLVQTSAGKIPASPESEAVFEAIMLANVYVSNRQVLSIENDLFLPLVYLKTVFDLSEFELHSIILSLACELDLKYEKIYGYIQDNVTLKHPSIGLAIKLFEVENMLNMNYLKYLEPQGKLLKYFYQDSKPGGTESSFLSGLLKLDRRMLHFINSPNSRDETISMFTSLFTTSDEAQPLLAGKNTLDKICNLVEKSYIPEKNSKDMVLNLHGAKGAGKKLQVKHFAKTFEQNILFIDVKTAVNSNMDFNRTMGKMCRESILQQAVVCFYNFDVLLDDTPLSEEKIKTIFSNLNSFSRIIFVLSETEWKLRQKLDNYMFVNIPVKTPDSAGRMSIWKQFAGWFALENGIDFASLANKFDFTPYQIQNALEDAKNTASLDNSDCIVTNILYKSCYKQVVHNLEKKAAFIYPIYNWDDIVLPEDQKNLLKNACNQVKFRHIVFGEWGFDKKLSYGKGLSMLFSGPPGTGKTMSAQVVANELHMELYKIQISQLVSKYIGETEKNLKEVFDEADKSGAILFFDEADSLFGKRSEVKDAHDRYANIEISYLLQQMEEYSGVTIMATNYLQNVDEAFMRRINFVIHFPFPDREQRKKIWISMYPKNAPLSEHIDFDFLSERFELSGGNIKNIAVSSAFLAAQSNSRIDMKHIIEALKYELGKNGKIILKEDLGEWA